MTKLPYQLVPAVGDNVQDVMRTFDGNSERLATDPSACHDSLVQSVAPLLKSRSVYEAVPSPEESCLAIEAGAREAQRVGLSEISQVLTSPSQREQKAMVEHLAKGISPGTAPQMEPTVQPSLRR